MADVDEEYERCPFCRISFRKWKKHVYSKRHRQVLHDVLTKFSKKVVAAKKLMKDPRVHKAYWETEVKHWCYFCAEEVQKHEFRDEGVTVESARFIKHLSSVEHKKKMLTFWKRHRVDKEKQKYYLIDVEKLEKFEELVEAAVEKFLTEQEMKRKTEAAKIDRMDKMRSRLVEHQRRNYMSQIPVTASYDGRRQMAVETGQLQSVRTVAARSDHLTFVTPKSFDVNVGNIHLGSLPPWMMADTEDTSKTGVIGPTQEDLSKHKENERKRKLPANRVGAKFNHKETTDESWMPSFGRVWSKQRRAHGQQKFIHSMSKNKRAVSATITSSDQMVSAYEKKINSDFSPHTNYAVSIDPAHPTAGSQNTTQRVDKPSQPFHYESMDPSAGDSHFSIKASIAKAVEGNINVVPESEHGGSSEKTSNSHFFPLSESGAEYGDNNYNGQKNPVDVFGPSSENGYHNGRNSGHGLPYDNNNPSIDHYNTGGYRGGYVASSFGPHWTHIKGHSGDTTSGHHMMFPNTHFNNPVIQDGKDQGESWNKTGVRNSVNTNPWSTGGYGSCGDNHLLQPESSRSLQGGVCEGAKPYFRGGMSSSKRQKTGENGDKKDGNKHRLKRIKIASSLL